MDPIWLIKLVLQLLQLYVAAVVGIVSRYGLSIDALHGNQSNKHKLALHKPLIHLNSSI